MVVIIPNRLWCNDHAMIRWIYSFKTKDEVSSDFLSLKSWYSGLDVVLRTRRMVWFGHVERNTGWIPEICKLNEIARKRPGRAKKTWDKMLMRERIK